MNAEAPPTLGPGGEQKPAETATISMGSFGAIFGALALIPILFLLFFHIGAGYLSYQKYGSMFWAFIDFLFAYFYYPYYAFFLAECPVSQPTMFGGKRSILNLLKMKW